MSTVSPPPSSTVININEKEPLLPLSSQQQPLPERPTSTKGWIQKHVPRLIIYGIIFHLLFHIFSFNRHDGRNIAYEELKHGDARDDTTFGLESAHDEVSAFNQQELMASNTRYCDSSNEPKIPFKGASEFKFDTNTFSNLSISQQTSHHRDTRISVTSKAIIAHDESLSSAVVNFDVKFDSEALQDIFWIEETQHQDDNAYSLVMHIDESPSVVGGCVSVDINARVPNAAALKVLSIALGNIGIDFQQGLIFEHLSVYVANGHIEFVEGLSSVDAAVFAIANGHIVGKIDTLKESLKASMANGHSEISIDEIKNDNDEAVIIKSSLANGRNSLVLPSNFNSQFSLNSFVGKRIVEADHPENIHRTSGGWGSTKGYYGSDKNTQNSVSLSSSHGSLHLAYKN